MAQERELFTQQRTTELAKANEALRECLDALASVPGDFHPEELEIAGALATQASLAIHLTRLAKSARQSAVLAERNRLAGEIHDALAQSFTGISMQLGVAAEQLAAADS